ncbi:UNVERIFIED_CONTAM: hypothetical protein Scaly_2235000 [Sesamum calycinum]|uniref:MULE transposase domain-containing protein n=1 Tax=Sesamum calycinum TaxID=2727403 RepID=A0AAW2M955_9LAMI
MNGPIFQIKTLKENHTCPRTYNNSLAKASYLVKRMENAIRDNPNIPVKQLKNTIKRKCKVNVSRAKVVRAKRQALNAIKGFNALQYGYLWDYCETLRRCNTGKVIIRKVEGSEPLVFEKLYLLVAVGRDSNDNMVPIAMVVVPIENKENWRWFLGELLEEMGGLVTGKLSFISDRQKRCNLEEYVDECYSKTTYLKRPPTYDEMPTACQDAPPLSQKDVLRSQPRMAKNNNATSNEQIGYQGRRNATLLGKRQKVDPSSIPASITPPIAPEDVPLLQPPKLENGPRSQPSLKC